MQPFFEKELSPLHVVDLRSLPQTCRELRTCEHILRAVRGVTCLSLERYIEQNSIRWSTDILSSVLVITENGLKKLTSTAKGLETRPNLLITDVLCLRHNPISLNEHQLLQRLFPKLRGRYFEYQYLSTAKKGRVLKRKVSGNGNLP